MQHYEATLDGKTELAEAYTNYDEVDEFEKVLEKLNWPFSQLTKGRGGYYKYSVEMERGKEPLIFQVYLKKVLFGGRENRPKEKRVQFSAGIDRTGFDTKESVDQISLILGIYKSYKDSETVICAWDMKDWGYNVGRAFNCFISIDSIANGLKEGFAQHRTSIGQIACCFTYLWFGFYLHTKEILHKELLGNEEIKRKEINITHSEDKSRIPRFEKLFQLITDILRSTKNGLLHVNQMESEAAEALKLSYDDQNVIHNINEGLRTELGYRLAWARYYLKRADLIESPKRSIWNLTTLGLNTAIIDKDAIIKIATGRQIQEDFKADILDDIKTENDANDVESEDNLINFIDPFDPAQVDMKTRTMSLDLILKRLDRDNIDMEASFQRKAGLWDLTKQSRLIESILIRFPLPAFYFDGSDDDKWLVVDGLQRLSSLHSFVNEQNFSLQNMEFLTQFNGKKFRELLPSLQRRIEESEITAYIIAPGTPKKLKYIVFRRINTGGLVLNQQEIRNALNPGKPSQFVKDLSELKSFKLATSFSIPEDRMLDREFVTRFLAFYLFSHEEYNGDLDSLLNTTMEELEKINLQEPLRLNQIEQSFDKAMQTSSAVFSAYAFRKRLSRNDKLKPINKALFEVWSVCLAKLNDDQRKIMTSLKNIIEEKFMELQRNDWEFNLAITSGTSSKLKVIKRFAEINNIIQSTLN